MAQNAPVLEKSAPESNNALPSGGSLGSQSGVNPMGNPGTIANSAASNSGANSAIAPHPNTERGVFLTSSPEGTVTGTTITTSNNQKVEAARVVTPTGTVTAVVKEPVVAPSTKPATTQTKTTRPTQTVDVSPPAAKKVAPAPTGVAPAKSTTKPLPAYKPVLGNYVSEATIDKINAKYGDAVYDIRAVRLASTNKIAYIVRLRENDTVRTELFYAD